MRRLKVEEMGRISVSEFKEAEKRPLVVILDNVRSMHNVGSVFRTADAFRLKKIYLCGITPRPPHREIRKTAIGATESVDWEYAADIEPVMTQLKGDGYQILALEQTDASQMLPEFSPAPDQPYALVLGHEINGVSDKALALTDVALEIPQFGTKHSLNISVAAGMALYALVFGTGISTP